MRKIIPIVLLCTLFLVSCDTKEKAITPEEAKALTEEAYIYAFPIIDHYKMMFVQAMYKESGAYEAPFNVVHNNSALLGPEYTAIIRPNNDTFYSLVWFNLTTEPMVLKVPAITDKRYYSFQIIDKYTHNIDYIGSRETGFEAGAYLFAGPNWKGENPEGIDKIIRSEGNFLAALGRTQVNGPDDVAMTQAIMNQYAVEPLSTFLGQAAPPQVAMPDFPPYQPEKVTSIEFIAYLNALMADGEIHPSEKAMFKRFEKIGIAPGKPFDTMGIDETIKTAMEEGVALANDKIIAEAAKLGERKNGWQMITGAFGTREIMQDRFLVRAAAAYFGLWGNSLEEAYYPETSFDSDNEELDATKHNYVLHFDKEELPPVKAFWSISMYKLPEQLFIENEINRYVISSATPGLKYNSDGSLDIYVQKENPGGHKTSNWLPAHKGKFSLQARLYWIDPQFLNPLYVLPSVEKTK